MQHGQPLLFYCFDHSEPVCFACIQLKGPHNGHKYDALDSAVAKLKQEVFSFLFLFFFLSFSFSFSFSFFFQ
jgi:hypothetical protein